jgi:glycerol kinase
VDGGMVVNSLLMQFQADILNEPVICPRMTETTALGAAYAAGLAVGYWHSLDDLRQNWGIDRVYEPAMDEAHRQRLTRGWQKAIERSFGWED